VTQIGGIARSVWVEARMNELPKYCTFLYNLLLDQKLDDEHKVHAFGTLFYVLEGGDILAQDDPMLGGLDALAFVFRCMSELIGRLPPANLAVYEEVLRRDGVALRELIPQAARYLDRFYFAVAALYKERIFRFAPSYKSAVQTGYLVKLLQSFLSSFKPSHWPNQRLEAVDRFLGSFAVEKMAKQAAPLPG
jgi:hypothetical protein